MKKSDISLLARIFGYFRPYRVRVIALVCMTLVASALSLATPLVMKFVIDEIIIKKQLGYFIHAVILLMAAYLGSALLSVFAAYLYNFVTQTALLRLRQDMYTTLERLPLSYFDRNATGDIMSRFLNDVNALQNVTTNIILAAITDTSVLIAAIVIMLYLDVRLTLLIVLTATTMPIVFYVFNRRLRDTSKQGQKAIADVSSCLQESIAGIRVIKSFVRELYHYQVFSRKLRESCVLSCLARFLRRASASSLLQGQRSFSYMADIR